MSEKNIILCQKDNMHTPVRVPPSHQTALDNLGSIPAFSGRFQEVPCGSNHHPRESRGATVGQQTAYEAGLSL